MDTNETSEPVIPQSGLILTPGAQLYLRETGKWAYFLGILGFIVTAIILVAAVFTGAIVSLMGRLQPENMPYPTEIAWVLSFVYIVVAVFYFVFSRYLFQFGSRVKKGIVLGSSADMTRAMGKLKSFFKLWGIITVVIVAINVLAVIIVVVVGLGGLSAVGK